MKQPTAQSSPAIVTQAKHHIPAHCPPTSFVKRLVPQEPLPLTEFLTAPMWRYYMGATCPARATMELVASGLEQQTAPWPGRQGSETSGGAYAILAQFRNRSSVVVARDVELILIWTWRVSCRGEECSFTCQGSDFEGPCH